MLWHWSRLGRISRHLLSPARASENSCDASCAYNSLVLEPQGCFGGTWHRLAHISAACLGLLWLHPQITPTSLRAFRTPKDRNAVEWTLFTSGGIVFGLVFFSFCNTRQFLYSAPLGKHRFLYVAAGNGAAWIFIVAFPRQFIRVGSGFNTFSWNLYRRICICAVLPCACWSAGRTHGMRIKNSHVWFGEKPENSWVSKNTEPNYKLHSFFCFFFLIWVELSLQNSSILLVFMCKTSSSEKCQRALLTNPPTTRPN